MGSVMESSVFPLLPKSSIDWDHLGFEPLDVNGHIECHYSDKTGEWSVPRFVQDPLLHIHGLAPALNFAQQIFEGMKAFRNNAGEIQLFRPAMNAARFAHSARFVSIPTVPEELFLKAVHLAVGLNSEFVPPHGSGAAMYIRPMAFASSATVGLSLANQFTFCVYVLPVAPLHGGGPDHGLDALVIEDFDRAAPEGTGSAKVGGNYGPVLGLIAEAKKNGYGLTLHLDSATRTVIDEFSTSGFMALCKNPDRTTLVVSDSRQIVRSITVDSMCKIARSFGWAVDRRAISVSELSKFDEVYAAGTAAVLVPVRSIGHRSTGRKYEYSADYQSPDSGFARLSSVLRGIQQGTVHDEWSWTEIVQEPKY